MMIGNIPLGCCTTESIMKMTGSMMIMMTGIR